MKLIVGERTGEDRLPRKAVESLSLEVFKRCVEVAIREDVV